MGERRAGEFQVDETGRSGRERRVTKDRRRGSDRRESNHRVPVERRIGFDRRTLRDRRAPLGQRHDTQSIWGSGAEAMAPPRQRARPSPYLKAQILPVSKSAYTYEPVSSGSFFPRYTNPPVSERDSECGCSTVGSVCGAGPSLRLG